MLDRKIKLLSEEWRALCYLMDLAQKLQKTRPSLSKAVGQAIMELAITKGYKHEDKHEFKQ
jgi:hypothetical protein